MIRISIEDEYRATYKDGTWTSTEPALTIALNTLERYRHEFAADGSIPLQDARAVEWADRFFKKVKVIQPSDEPPPATQPGVVY